MEEFGDVFGGSTAQERGARFRAQLAQGFHGEPGVALDEDGERGRAISFRERREDLRQIGGVLLLEQVDEIGRRADADQPLDRIEDDVDFALGH